jgi:hypothetical protein
MFSDIYHFPDLSVAELIEENQVTVHTTGVPTVYILGIEKSHRQRTLRFSQCTPKLPNLKQNLIGRIRQNPDIALLVLLGVSHPIHAFPALNNDPVDRWSMRYQHSPSHSRCRAQRSDDHRIVRRSLCGSFRPHF